MLGSTTGACTDSTCRKGQLALRCLPASWRYSGLLTSRYRLSGLLGTKSPAPPTPSLPPPLPAVPPPPSAFDAPSAASPLLPALRAAASLPAWPSATARVPPSAVLVRPVRLQGRGQGPSPAVGCLPKKKSQHCRQQNACIQHHEMEMAVAATVRTNGARALSGAALTSARSGPCTSRPRRRCPRCTIVPAADGIALPRSASYGHRRHRGQQQRWRLAAAGRRPPPPAGTAALRLKGAPIDCSDLLSSASLRSGSFRGTAYREKQEVLGELSSEP